MVIFITQMAKNSFFDVFCPKNLILLEKWVFRHLGDENDHGTPRRSPVPLFGLPWGFTPNQCLSPQKNILPLRTLSPKKIESRNLEKSTFLEKNLKKFGRFRNFGRNFCVLNVAEISAARGAPPKITTFQDFNPRAIPRTLAKLWSSGYKKLLAKSLSFDPPGGYLL